MVSISFPTSPGDRHSCQPSLTITTGARSHAPRHSTSTQRERARRVGLARLDVQRARKFLGDTLGPFQRARQRPADLNYVLADRLLVEHRVVRGDVLHFRRRASDDLGDVTHGVRREIADPVLHHEQRVEHGRLALLGRIVSRQLLEPLALVGREGKRLAFRRQLALGVLKALLVRHLRMEAHRSTSPMTMSVDPMIATTSAMRAPTHIGSIA